MMRKFIFLTSFTFFLFCCASSVKAQKNPDNKTRKVLYFNPQVDPDIEEIKEPTNTAFFSAVSDEFKRKEKQDA